MNKLRRKGIIAAATLLAAVGFQGATSTIASAQHDRSVPRALAPLTRLQPVALFPTVFPGPTSRGKIRVLNIAADKRFDPGIEFDSAITRCCSSGGLSLSLEVSRFDLADYSHEIGFFRSQRPGKAYRLRGQRIRCRYGDTRFGFLWREHGQRRTYQVLSEYFGGVTCTDLAIMVKSMRPV